MNLPIRGGRFLRWGGCLGLASTLLLAQAPASQPAQGWAASMSSRYGGSEGGSANAALSGDPTGRCSFHTENDASAWWMVDFQKEITLDSMRIYNRMDCCSGRAYGLEVKLAPEGADPSLRESWKTLYTNNGKAFGGVDPGHPAKDLPGEQGPLFVPMNGRKARYLRIQVTGGNPLHLDKVRIKEKKASGEAERGADTDERDLLGNPKDPFAGKP